jgi:hypothetical protein
MNTKCKNRKPVAIGSTIQVSTNLHMPTRTVFDPRNGAGT